MIERFLDGLHEKMKDPVDCTGMSIVVPGDIDPFERHHRYSVHLDAELRLAGMGCSEGGGTLFFDSEDDDREAEICYCIGARARHPCRNTSAVGRPRRPLRRRMLAIGFAAELGRIRPVTDLLRSPPACLLRAPGEKSYDEAELTAIAEKVTAAAAKLGGILRG